jgi:hypothetical protein
MSTDTSETPVLPSSPIVAAATDSNCGWTVYLWANGIELFEESRPMGPLTTIPTSLLWYNPEYWVLNLNSSVELRTSPSTTFGSILTNGTLLSSSIRVPIFFVRRTRSTDSSPG